MGSLVAAYRANTPLIVTAGQQTREMLLCDPYLANKDETLLPQPWVKWAYQPVRAEDVPAAFMRACATAVQPPAGPVFLSIPHFLIVYLTRPLRTHFVRTYDEFSWRANELFDAAADGRRHGR